MSLEHAILGFLQYGPSSGYDLKAIFDLSVQHFLRADQSQIYRTLARLTAHGWANIEVIEQSDRPDRKVYHVTDTGREELRRWLVTPLPAKVARNAALVQLFFSGQLTDDEILTTLRRYARQLEDELTVLRAIPRSCPPGVGAQAPPEEHYFWFLTLDYGIHMAEASLAWFHNVISRIERGEHRKGAEHENPGG